MLHAYSYLHFEQKKHVRICAHAGGCLQADVLSCARTKEILTGSDANEAAFTAAFTYLTHWYFTTYIITRSSHRMQKKSQLKTTKRCDDQSSVGYNEIVVGTRKSETKIYILRCKFAMSPQELTFTSSVAKLPSITAFANPVEKSGHGAKRKHLCIWTVRLGGAGGRVYR